MKRPMFKYFSSKHRSSKHYPPPKYNKIYEPFAGSAGYSLRYHERKVILSDSDAELILLWKWLFNVTPEEILALPYETLIVGQDLRTIGLSSEAADLIRRWQRTGNCSSWTVSRFNHILRVTNGKPNWMTGPLKNGTVTKNTGMWHPNTRTYLAENVTKIRHWQAHWMPYWEIDTNVEPATWFLDPPYQHVKGGFKENTPINYSHLRDWLMKLPGQVIVCEQEGANWLPFEPCCLVSGIRGKMRGKAGAQSVEMIYTHNSTE